MNYSVGFFTKTKFTMLEKLEHNTYRFLAPHMTTTLVISDVVLGVSCSQEKHTAAHVLPGQKMLTASFDLAKDAKGNLQPTIYNHMCVRKRLIDT